MQVKTYTGKNTQALLAQIKEELGPDAVILSNRTLRVDGQRIYEVTAGVDRSAAAMAPSVGASRATAKAAYAHTAAPQEMPSDYFPQGPAQNLVSPSEKVKQMASQWMEEGHFPGENASIGQERRSSSHATSSARGMRSGGFDGLSDALGSHPTGWGEWHKEWQQIKDHLFALMKPSIQMEKLTPRQRVALEYLQREGVNDAIILRLYRRLLMAPNDSVLQYLSEIVPVLSWNTEAWPQRIHCFAGPFGVGKTTTALRMALQLRAQNSLCRVAFINADCQRGNGRLILRHWAELSDFSYTEASDAVSMNKALIAQAHVDKIFIDLPSLGARGTLQEQYATLGLESDHVGSKATHIVMAPTYDSAQLINFLQRYSPDDAGSVVWAKLDEALSFGSIVNAATHCHLPVSALSCGAELRDSLVSASEPLLWRLIFKRQLPSTGQAQ